MITDPLMKKQAGEFLKLFCQENSPGFVFCVTTIFSICGINWGGLEMDTKLLQKIYPYTSSTAAGKQFDHYFQIIKNERFQLFDYKDNNTRVYNSSSPPMYKLDNFKAPVYLYDAEFDALISAQGVDQLETTLPNVRARKSFKNFNHCDFNYGKNAKTLLYDDMMKAMLAEK